MTVPQERPLGRIVGLHTVVLQNISAAKSSLRALRSILDEEGDSVANDDAWDSAEILLTRLMEASRSRVRALVGPHEADDSDEDSGQSDEESRQQ